MVRRVSKLCLQPAAGTMMINATFQRIFLYINQHNGTFDHRVIRKNICRIENVVRFIIRSPVMRVVGWCDGAG